MERKVSRRIYTSFINNFFFKQLFMTIIPREVEEIKTLIYSPPRGSFPYTLEITALLLLPTGNGRRYEYAALTASFKEAPSILHLGKVNPKHLLFEQYQDLDAVDYRISGKKYRGVLELTTSHLERLLTYEQILSLPGIQEKESLLQPKRVIPSAQDLRL